MQEGGGDDCMWSCPQPAIQCSYLSVWMLTGAPTSTAFWTMPLRGGGGRAVSVENECEQATMQGRLGLGIRRFGRTQVWNSEMVWANWLGW